MFEAFEPNFGVFGLRREFYPPIFDLSVNLYRLGIYGRWEKYYFRFKPVGLSMTWAQFSTPIIDIVLVVPLLLS